MNKEWIESLVHWINQNTVM